MTEEETNRNKEEIVIAVAAENSGQSSSSKPISGRQRRRRRLVRVTDWEEGVRRIHSWPGFTADGGDEAADAVPHPMYAPAILVGETLFQRVSSAAAKSGGDEDDKKKKKAVVFATAEDLNEHRPAELVQQQDIRFALQATLGGPGATYEQLIHNHGTVLTRNTCWHDILNGLTWFYAPAGKRALNRLQVAAANAANADKNIISTTAKTSSGGGRSPLQAKLAHFDECGGVLLLPAAASEDDECRNRSMRSMLEQRDWLGLFCESRRSWLPEEKSAQMIVFGHGLLEQGLMRVPTMVAHSIVFELQQNNSANGGGALRWKDHPVSERPLKDLELSEVLQLVDRLLQLYFDELTRDLKMHSSSGGAATSTDDSDLELLATLPVPILGIPGWSPDNQDESFYQNKAIFR